MVNKALFSSTKQDWQTPKVLYDKIDKGAGGILIDAAADETNHQCDLWYGPGSNITEDALSFDWIKGKTHFLNPPFKGIEKWYQKCALEAERGITTFMLTPARCDTRYFHDHVPQWARRIWILKGRVPFVGGKYTSTFPTLIIQWSNADPWAPLAWYFWDWRNENMPC